jgi:hypothetical protein
MISAKALLSTLSQFATNIPPSSYYSTAAILDFASALLFLLSELIACQRMVILKLLIPSIFKFEKGELSGAILGIHPTHISDSSLITCPNQLSDPIHDVRR